MPRGNGEILHTNESIYRNVLVIVLLGETMSLLFFFEATRVKLLDDGRMSELYLYSCADNKNMPKNYLDMRCSYEQRV